MGTRLIGGGQAWDVAFCGEAEIKPGSLHSAARRSQAERQRRPSRSGRDDTL